MALVGIMRRSATVRARVALRALVLPYANVATLADKHQQTFVILLMRMAPSRPATRKWASPSGLQSVLSRPAA